MSFRVKHLQTMPPEPTQPPNQSAQAAVAATARYAALQRQAGPQLYAGVDGPLCRLLGRGAALARREQMGLWLVGGAVRDLLLGRPLMRDLDLAVEGDGVALAHVLAAELGGVVRAAHRPFGTATVELARSELAAETAGPDVLTLDLASTRREHYPQPGALPVVVPESLGTTSIAADLARRDFSINALALEVPPNLTAQPASWVGARFVDSLGGLADLAAGWLRVLHDQSFADDPTRILRGLRLAARLGLQFAPPTRDLLAAALANNLLAAAGPDRLRTELCLVLDEPQPGRVWRLADELAVTPQLCAPLARSAWADQGQQVLDNGQHSGKPLLRAGIATYGLTLAEREELIAHYRLPGEVARLLREVGQLRAHLDELARPDLRNSELDQLLRPCHPTAQDVVRYCAGGPIGERLGAYASNLRAVAPLLDGHALRQLGVAPGPRLGALLAGLRAARLDGLVTTRADEEAWVCQQMGQQPGGAP